MNRENRLELVKQALTLLVDQLRPTDEIGIVIYGSTAQVVLPHTRNVNREHILAAIHSLSPGGAQRMREEGLRKGYQLASQNLGTRLHQPCDSLFGWCSECWTDGDQMRFLQRSGYYVKEGILLTTVGFGMGNYNDILMEQLANKGNGSYAYVDTLKEAERVFVENLTGTLQIIAKDAKVQVEFNPQTVSRFRLLGYENRRLAQEDFRDDDVDAGEIGSGHSVTALYEI